MFLYAVVLYAEWWRYSRQLFSIRRNNQFQYIWLSGSICEFDLIMIDGKFAWINLTSCTIYRNPFVKLFAFFFLLLFFFLSLLLLIFFLCFSAGKVNENEQKNCFNYILITVCRKYINLNLNVQVHLKSSSWSE